MYTLLFIVLGYLSGSILFARLYGQLFLRQDYLAESKDTNPGVFNAFVYGGWPCGLFTLFGDFFKAFLPVYLYVHLGADSISLHPGLSLVMTAPIIGHIFPLFYRFEGGKGITASFGSLAAIWPMWQPLACLAGLFLFFTMVLNIKTNYWKTILVYFLFPLLSSLCSVPVAIHWSPLLISGVILCKLAISRETPGPFEVILPWKHS